MLPVQVRELWATDLDKGFFQALAALRDSNLTLEQARQIHRRRLALGIKTYVALLGPKVLGTATLVPEPKFYGTVGHIEDVAVHPDHQRQDIGTTLMRYAIGEARAMGCYKVILDCTEEVKAFYEQLGFHTHNLGMRLDIT